MPGENPESNFFNMLEASSTVGMDCDMKEDIFDVFNDLDLVLPVDDTVDAQMSLGTDLCDSFLEDLDCKWPECTDQVLADTNFVKIEPGSPTDSSRSSESNSPFDHKNVLETPPDSPPLMSEIPISLNCGLIEPQTFPVISSAQTMIIPKTTKQKGKQGQETSLPKGIVDNVNIKQEPDFNEKITKIPLSPISTALTCNPILTQSSQNSNIQTTISFVQNNSILIPVVKQEADPSRREDLKMRAIKRQQRMIKNRESANLSRKRKKEYVASLETRLNEVESENARLRLENNALKIRVKELETGYPDLSKNKPFLNSNMRKATAVLAVLFMVSVNVGSIRMLRDTTPEEFKVASRLNGPSFERHGRSLLWAAPEISDESDNDASEERSNRTVPGLKPGCRFINQTESIRLEKELRHWIAVDGERVKYKNSTRPKKIPKPSVKNLLFHSVRNSKMQRLQRRTMSAVDVYRPPFPGSIPRRDDTFYVLSFSNDHLLIPAVAHNNTLRPKMSFVIPIAQFNGLNGSVPMMQIDCEVLATKSIQFTEKDFAIFRPVPKSGNKDNSTNPERSANANSSFKPYFLHKERSKPESEYDDSFDTHLLNRNYRAAAAFP